MKHLKKIFEFNEDNSFSKIEDYFLTCVAKWNIRYDFEVYPFKEWVKNTHLTQAGNENTLLYSIENKLGVIKFTIDWCIVSDDFDHDQIVEEFLKLKSRFIKMGCNDISIRNDLPGVLPKFRSIEMTIKR